MSADKSDPIPSAEEQKDEQHKPKTRTYGISDGLPCILNFGSTVSLGRTEPTKPTASYHPRYWEDPNGGPVHAPWMQLVSFSGKSARYAIPHVCDSHPFNLHLAMEMLSRKFVSKGLTLNMAPGLVWLYHENCSFDKEQRIRDYEEDGYKFPVIRWICHAGPGALQMKDALELCEEFMGLGIATSDHHPSGADNTEYLDIRRQFELGYEVMPFVTCYTSSPKNRSTHVTCEHVVMRRRPVDGGQALFDVSVPDERVVPPVVNGLIRLAVKRKKCTLIITFAKFEHIYGSLKATSGRITQIRVEKDFAVSDESVTAEDAWEAINAGAPVSFGGIRKVQHSRLVELFGESPFLAESPEDEFYVRDLKDLSEVKNLTENEVPRLPASVAEYVGTLTHPLTRKVLRAGQPEIEDVNGLISSFVVYRP
jgi:hypothetical protein